MLVTKDLNNKVFVYIDPWGENLASIAWEIGVSYHLTIGDTSGQAVIGGGMIFCLPSAIDHQVITTKKQQQVEVDTDQKTIGKSTMTSQFVT